MNFSLTEEQKTLRESIVRFARNELNEDVVERDRTQTFRRDLWTKCGEMGILGLPIPEEYGGSGLDPFSTAIALEALGYGCGDAGLVFSISAHLLPCVVPIGMFGAEEQKRRLLPDLCGGKRIAANAMTGPGTGSDAFGMKKRAVRDGKGFRLTGTKMFCSNGPIADLAVVFAVTDPEKGYHGGITTFLVEKETEGFRASQKFEKMGLRTSPIGELVLENAFVSEDAVLGGVGGGAAVFAHSMDWERILLFATHVGTMERLLEKAVEYARTRTQFGQPIGKFQAVAHKIADMKVRLEAARLLVYRSAWKLGEKKSVSMDASITKLFVSESLLETALDTVQVLGGYGFMTEYEVERALRDAIGSTIYSGTSEMQRNIIARWLGL
ncbi:MAG: acyl-CoA dehydrogenase family protein [Candidatus Eisenbacteria bacterium]|nr:acyl-CoA dehydrogenase family protein [Candidatus Eisenbacteria bacterium]